jgi:hypothetical protein
VEDLLEVGHASPYHYSLVEAAGQQDANEDVTSKDISERVHTEVCNLQS